MNRKTIISLSVLGVVSAALLVFALSQANTGSSTVPAGTPTTAVTVPNGPIIEPAMPIRPITPPFLRGSIAPREQGATKD